MTSFTLITPASRAGNEPLPLVFDSPHSGIALPDLFKSIASIDQLKTGWDAYIEQLWSSVPSQGGYLLHARFSRMYIDLNRAPDDIDPSLVNESWSFCAPTPYSNRGMGLIRKYAVPGVAMYADPLSIDEINHRLSQVYRPYHDTLKQLLTELHQKHNKVWHIDCHSMKSQGNAMNIDNGALRPDIILGDNDGKCASREFVDVIEQAFMAKGYSTARNKPYKGGYLIKHYADITQNKHSMQIEINRRLYMDEKAFSPNANFEQFQEDLASISHTIANYVRSQL